VPESGKMKVSPGRKDYITMVAIVLQVHWQVIQSYDKLLLLQVLLLTMDDVSLYLGPQKPDV
jgi:hypothetical protein